MKLGRLIKVYRTWEEINIRDMAKELGTSAATLSRFEKGLDVDLPTFLRIQAWVLEPTKKTGEAQR